MPRLLRRTVTRLLTCLLTGASAFLVGGCTTDDFRAQFAKGMASAINGLLGITVTEVTNDLFRVEE
jgi:hypothetical protein